MGFLIGGITAAAGILILFFHQGVVRLFNGVGVDQPANDLHPADD